MVTIKAPNKNYNGSTYGVPFVNGVGHTDNTWLVQMFKEAGYVVADGTEVEPVEEEEKANSALLDKMTLTELKDYAAENNIDLGGATRKADIVALIEKEG